LEVGVLLGYGDARETVEEFAAYRNSAGPQDCRWAVQTLLKRPDKRLLHLLVYAIEFDDQMRGNTVRDIAIRGIAAFNHPDTPELLIDNYSRFTPSERSDAVQTLASRPTYALALLEAVEKRAVPREDISPVVARQILSLKNPKVTEKLSKVWGTVRPASKDRPALTARYKAILTPDALKKADAANGKLVFAKTCASCHKLFGEGASIGPDLTGSQRSNLDYILENVLDPSAVVAREYQVVVVELKSGRTLNGIIKSETDRAVTVQTQNEAVVVPKADIESRTQTNVSMMPEGLFDKLSDNEVRNLVGYLMGPQRK
jgi:putative heme-binding domain-containing protein